MQFRSKHVATSIAFVASLSSLWCSAGQSAVTVSPAGTAHFERAISVPPGAGGFGPTLGLIYDTSNTDNGTLGMGWTLRAVEAITRCDTTRVLDSLPPAGVRYTSADRLCLNGKRLIPTQPDASSPRVGAGTNDAAGQAAGQFIEYRTESDPYTRVRAYGYADGSSAASGPAFFKVWTKSGLIYSYGADPAVDASPAVASNALIKAYYPAGQTTQYAQLWAVSRISDRHGNFVDFKYTQNSTAWGSNGSYQTGHESTLSEIQYSGNKVVFNYTTRAGSSPQDSSETYNNGSKNVSTQRLASIVTYINSANPGSLGPASVAIPVTTYNFTYDNGPVTQRSRLTKLTQCAGGTTSTNCLAPVSMAYTAGATDAYAKNTAFNLETTLLETFGPTDSAGNYTSVTAVDMNGDGLTDLVVTTAHTVTIYNSNGDGSFTQNTSYNGKVTVVTPDHCGYFTALVDINGDGLPDVVRYPNVDYYDTNLPCPTPNVAEIQINQGNGTFSHVGVLTLLGGMQQLLPAGGAQYYQNGGIGTAFANGRPGKSFYFLDVDNDGIADLVTSIEPVAGVAQCANAAAYPAGCTHVYKGVGDGTFNEIPTNIATQSIYSNSANVRGIAALADIDGDGLTDILVSRYDAGASALGQRYIKVARSQGNGNFDVWTGPQCPIAGTTLMPCGALPLDYNGTGKSSVLFAVDAAPASNVLYLPDTASNALSAVSNFNLTTASDVLMQNANAVVTNVSSFYAADFNGDGRTDILRTSTNPANNTLYLSNGDGTFTPSTTFNLNTSGSQDYYLKGDVHPVTALRELLVGNFRGAGQPDILRLSSLYWTAGKGNVLLAKTSTELPDVLTSVTDEQGAVTQLRYVTGTAPTFSGNTLGPRYATDRGTANAAAKPKVDLAAEGLVVAGIDYDAGVGSLKQSVEYAYRGFKGDLNGRGLLGFREVRSQALGPDGNPLTTVTQYVQDFPYIGKPAASATYQSTLNSTGSSGQLSTTANLYCDQTAASGADTSALSSGVNCTSSSVLRKPYVLRSVTSGVDLNGASFVLPTVTTQQSISASGEPLVTATSSTGPGGDTFTKTVTNTPFADNTTCSDTQTCNWLLGLVSRQTVRGQAPGTLLATAAPTLPGLTLTGCVSSGTTQVPTAATYSCVLGNTGREGTNVSYSTSATGVTLTGPSLCPALSNNCGPVVLTSGTAAGVYTGTLTATPVIGSAVTLSSVTLTVLNPSASLTTSVAYGNVSVGNNSSASVTLTNTGAGPISLTVPTAASVTGADFNFVSTTCTSSLAAGASCTVIVQFAPSTVSSRAGTLSVVTSAGTLSSSLSGTGTPILSVSPTSVAFGNVTIGTGAYPSGTFTLTNGGNVTASGIAISPGAGYGVINNTCGGSLAAGGTCTFALAFTPTAAQAYNNNASVSSSNAGSPVITVTGTGVPLPAPPTPSFSPTIVTLGTPSTLSWPAVASAVSYDVGCTAWGVLYYRGPDTSVSVNTPNLGTMTCSVMARNSAGVSNGSGSASVTVVNAPGTPSPSFSPTSVVTGTPSTLSWAATANATSYSINCLSPAVGGGSTGAATSVSVFTGGTGIGSCSVTAYNAAGTASPSGSANLAVTPSNVLTYTPTSGTSLSSVSASDSGPDPAVLTVSVTGSTTVSWSFSNLTGLTTGGTCVQGGTVTNSSCTITFYRGGSTATVTTTGTLTVTTGIGTNASYPYTAKYVKVATNCCPAAWQAIETQEQGFTAVGHVQPGMHVRAPNGVDWVEVYGARADIDHLYRLYVGDDAVDVNEGHWVMLTDGSWRMVGDLKVGEAVKGVHGEAVLVKRVVPLGLGSFMNLQVEGQGYQLGHTVGHNITQPCG